MVERQRTKICNFAWDMMFARIGRFAVVYWSLRETTGNFVNIGSWVGISKYQERMSYAEHGPRIFLTGRPSSGVPLTYGDYVLSQKRSEGRMKLYNSCTDIRAWSPNVLESTRYFRELNEHDKPAVRFPRGSFSSSFLSFFFKFFLRNGAYSEERFIFYSYT